MPAEEPSPFNLANGFTFLRVLLVPLIGYLLVISAGDVDGDNGTRWWAFGIFVFAALTDSVDGWLARRLVGITRWGQMADPLADKLLIIGSLIVLAALRELPWWAVVVIVAREAAVTWLRGRLLRDIDVVMPASVWGKVKTVAQVLAVTLYLYPDVGAPVRQIALGIAIVATVASGLEYVARIRRIRRAHATTVATLKEMQ
ncbi:MAG TPA: CDP-diacylglycerol--glycerol-3-phosphate 3-phosphatidyltransferase [Euzebya sp.]|nr:CDP-diacylglycerol--glycerol-3-phosphate 3-phosphatidyltransferase [Euzebya sp.]